MDEESGPRTLSHEAIIPRWMPTFADIMTLLMCFFVLLLTFAEMDVRRYKQIASSMAEAFGGQRPADGEGPFPWTGIVFGLALVMAVSYMSGNQLIVQRTLGARSEWDAKGGMLFGGFLKVFIPLMVALPGLCAVVLVPGLVTDAQRQELVELLFKHQRAEGGWSMRTFAAPESWGGGNRAAKLRGEPEFANPPSDGHQTGLAIIVLRSAGVDAKDSRIQRGIEWLKSNQRESGRWWTRSLNTGSWHFITYSGTCYPLLALAQCDELPAN